MGPTLADVATSAAAAVGVPDYDDVLGIGPARHAVVCLVDGLGANLVARHPGVAPFLTGLAGAPIRAAFPTTTPVGLASLGTGLLAGRHGFVGASFRLPETDEILLPLQWGREPAPVAVQPEPTVFEIAARRGIHVATITAPEYRESGLTRSVLRGGEYLGVRDAYDRVAALTEVLAGPGPSLSYLYWPELDRVGHEFGVASEEWRAALGRVDALVSALAQVAVEHGGGDVVLVITADHGMVDCAADGAIWVDADADLSAGVVAIAGEPRMRHVYAAPGAAAEVAATWRSVLDGRARVLTRAEVVDSGLMGEVDPALADRMGDLVAIAEGATLLSSSWDQRISTLVGQHGALTDDETAIPALVHRS